MKSQSSEAENLINVVWNVQQTTCKREPVGMQGSVGGGIRELVLPRIVFIHSGIGDVASYSRSADVGHHCLPNRMKYWSCF